jgi:hypothetical protein
VTKDFFSAIEPCLSPAKYCHLSDTVNEISKGHSKYSYLKIVEECGKIVTSISMGLLPYFFVK